MNKKNVFPTSVATLATSVLQHSIAALSKSVTNCLTRPVAEAATANTTTEHLAADPFVFEHAHASDRSRRSHYFSQ
jgi:hypothetical protein